MSAGTFEIVCEVEPPRSADRAVLLAQVDALAPVASRFLVPDNHTGRATVSSLVLAEDIRHRGHQAVVCLNARDRNVLGLRRDLLTAQYCGIDEVLLVYGDRPAGAPRTSGLTVRTMLDELRAAVPDRSLRGAVTTGLTPLPAWKREADALFVQVTYELDALLRWRDGVRFDGPIHAGVLVPASSRMARGLGERVPELRPPSSWLDALEVDDRAGVELACRHLERIRRSGAFDGAHLVCGARAHEIVAHVAPMTGVEPCGDDQRRDHRTPWRRRALA
jgi:5,10-methylenetetrahydrofolate reductase